MRMPLRLLVFTAVSSTMVTSQAPPPQQPQPMTNAPGHFVTPTLYELLQRQNQLNNALLLNHALISNQMAAGLHDNHLHTPPTFPPFPQQTPNIPPLLYPQHMQGLLPQNLPGSSAEKLAIYDALSPMQAPKPAEIAAIPIPVAPVVSGVVQVPVGKPNEELVFFTTNAKNNKEKLAEDPKAMLKIKALETALAFSTTPSTAEVDVLESTTQEQKVTTTNHALSILKNLNLTEAESEKLVLLVEQVVREELAKKLAAKASAVTATTAPLPVAPSTTTPVPSNTGMDFSKDQDKSTMLTEDTMHVDHEETTPKFAGPTEYTQEPIDRSDRLLESEIPEIKLHPPKRIEEKDDSYVAIKTSETHLTAIERAAEEEEREREAARKRYNKATLEPIVETTTVAVSSTTEEFDPAKVKPIPRRSFLETDSDLLALATGAPLDLSDETAQEEAAYRNRFHATKPPTISKRVTKPAMIPRLRSSTPPSQFVRLAADYRQRLANTEDVTKLLKHFYDNAFIQLVANEVNPRKINKPQEVQYSPSFGR